MNLLIAEVLSDCKLFCSEKLFPGQWHRMLDGPLRVLNRCLQWVSVALLQLLKSLRDCLNDGTLVFREQKENFFQSEYIPLEKLSCLNLRAVTFSCSMLDCRLSQEQGQNPSKSGGVRPMRYKFDSCKQSAWAAGFQLF